MSVRAYEDAARFDPYDAGEIVAASFACPCCLATPGDVVVEATDLLPSASCWCATCEVTWTVHLDERQAMRLALAPPAELLRPGRG
jgi:hypothetical protein